MKSAWLAGIALLAACAAHNSHTVRLRPEELAPLVADALARTQADYGQPLAAPVEIRAGVEDVPVRWVLPADASVPSAPNEPVRLEPTLVAAARARLAGGAPAEFVMRVRLELDLHVPDRIALRVACALSRASEPGTRLAEGCSDALLLARTYCFGCRDAAPGLGTSIAVSGAVAYDYDPWFVPIPCNPSDPGYTKH